MRKILLLCAFALTVLSSPSALLAADTSLYKNSSARAVPAPILIASGNCAAKADTVAASYKNAQILSVEESGSSCIIVIRINAKDGSPPRIIRKTVSG
ncbi:MAG: hypothetical protein L3J32_06065 [Rhizobiaceae bacterium]|nr:hypothetical protein [Rhizobiaceae bacterium]